MQLNGKHIKIAIEKNTLQYQCQEFAMHKILIIKKMFNNDKNLQLYAPKQLSKSIVQWLDQQIHEIYTSTKKKINLSIVLSDIFSQPFLAKFLLKVNYDFFSKTQLMDFIDSSMSRKLCFIDRKLKFLGFIQKYLHSYERRKFTQIYRTFLFSSKKDSEKQEASYEVIRLLLFIAIRSENKNQFIERIFKMSTENQQNLMDEIMQVENILEKITQKQEIMLQFNYLKEHNKKMNNNYQELVDYQNKLLDQCQNQEYSKNSLENKNQQNRNQKMQVCESLSINDLQKPYLKIYKTLEDKNVNLTRILVEKQKKQNQLLERFTSLKQKSDEFQEVLFELNRQKKKLKVMLNDKKNESFQLEMRASLRLSQQKQYLRRSEALRRKSLANCRTALKETSNNILLSNNNRLGTKSKQDQYSEINQSVNILAKIEEMKSQKKSLIKQLNDLKAHNKKLKSRDHSSKQTFVSLQQIYAQILVIYPEFTEPNKELKKQRSKTTFRTTSQRYL